MKIFVEKDYDAISERAAEIIMNEVKNKPDCVLGLATGGTPVGAYERIRRAYAMGKIPFAAVRTVNLDEYAGLRPEHPESYRYFMDSNLFDHIDITRSNTHLPNGLAENVAEECARYDAMIKRLGGIDLQLLGIGHNGHIGFNEPDSVFHVGTHEVVLSESTREANSKYFGSASAVPKSAITLGMGGIMGANRVLLIASGEAKREAILKTVRGEVDPMVPASILKLHRDVTIICDFEID